MPTTTGARRRRRTSSGSATAYDVSGVIGTRTDTDVFALTLSCTTDLVVSAKGIGRQSALDLSVELLDAAGNSLAGSSPPSTWSGSPPASAGMDAQVSRPGATGTYHVRVDGVGNGDPAGTGWSDYGSLGQYRLTASGCPDAPESDTAGGNSAGRAPPLPHPRRLACQHHPDEQHAGDQPPLGAAHRHRVLRSPGWARHGRGAVGGSVEHGRGADHQVPRAGTAS